MKEFIDLVAKNPDLNDYFHDEKPEPKEDKCLFCGDIFMSEPIEFGGAWGYGGFCSTKCHHSHLEAESRRTLAEAGLLNITAEQRAKNAQVAYYERICPPAFQQTDISKLPPSAKWKEVKSWEYGEKGLVVHGDSRTGKTRCLWLLLKKLIIEEGRRVSYFAAEDLAIEIAESFRDSHAIGHHNLMADFRSVPVLVIDDLGKEVMTPRVESSLFKIIRSRGDHLKPTIITTNYSGEELIKRFRDESTAIPFILRLQEFCHFIPFEYVEEDIEVSQMELAV